ncbi:hypothetical protein [Streptomyces sp. NPDC004783]|uniref:hypothetical protein n=1 Tax=Streptomyces sp. NPDC004783 TaxID=3154459 RepID=UPI0033BB5CF7
MAGVLEAGAADGFGAGIRRGVMAGDRFTQIANGLFRDGRLSFKAKGLFGLLSTRREGWRMTVTDLARSGREGEAAVKSGLKELEQRLPQPGTRARPRRHPWCGGVLHHRPARPAKPQVTTRVGLPISG